MSLINMMCRFVVIVLLTQVYVNEGANILGIFPFAARSHSFVDFALVQELARRGHQVTVITHHPTKESIPNYKDIAVKTNMIDILTDGGKVKHDFFDRQNTNPIVLLKNMWHANQVVCDGMLQEEAVQKLIHSTDLHFDLIIMETFFNECFLGFVHKFKAPLIQICTFGGTHWMGDFVGNPSPYAYVPDVFLKFSDRMSFWERTMNTLMGTFMRLGREYYYLPGQDEIMRKYFNESDDLPSVSEIEHTTSLLLLNSHFSLNFPRPLMPNIIQVGGMHMKPPKDLPQDLKKYLDEATDGVVYFSMGSNIPSSDFPEVKRKAFLQAFSKLKQKVLWKWETDTLPGQPSNVKLSKWFPQSDILAHSNVRVFMTHGGLLSTQEAINRGVPMVGIPVFGDQELNMARAVSSGYGILLEYENVTAESVSWALNEVLGNPRYHENAQRLSRIYQDQPLTPLEQAVFWTEYVIRHKGAPHMRSAVLDLTWYQYFLLDVIAVLVLAVASVTFVVVFILRTLYRKMCGVKQEKNVLKRQKKVN